MPVPVLVRNTEAGPTVFTDTSKNIALEWAGAGDPSGEDVQQVPADILENVSFMRSLQRGIFVVEEATPEVQAILDRQTATWRSRREQAEQASADSIDVEANNDLVTLPCIGPSQRGTGECGEPVPVKDKARDEKPPLCSRHASLAPQYVVSETDQIVDGKPVKKWSRAMTSSAPLPSQQ